MKLELIAWTAVEYIRSLYGMKNPTSILTKGINSFVIGQIDKEINNNLEYWNWETAMDVIKDLPETIMLLRTKRNQLDQNKES